MNPEVSINVRRLAERWAAMKKSDIALRGEDMDALKAMRNEDLVLLAWEALQCIEATQPYDYIMSALEGHLEGPGSHYEGWIVAQADGGNNEGGFNKWTKVIGGIMQRMEGPRAAGDWLINAKWADAKAILNALDPAVRANFRIYPVVLSAGNEPRTTRPVNERD